jgi:hypothetical protein
VKAPIKGTARGEVETRVLDLSLSGALLHLGAACAEGGIHDFVLHLDGTPVWVQGEVLRCRPAERGGFQVAVQFVGIAPEHQRTLEQYLSRRQ